MSGAIAATNISCVFGPSFDEAMAWGSARLETVRKVAAVWGQAVAQGLGSVFFCLWSGLGVLAALRALPTFSAFDPFIYSIGGPGLFGIFGAIMTPVYLRGIYRAATATGENWKQRAINLVVNLGGLGMSIGSTANVVFFIWEQTRPFLGWIPGLRLVSAAISGLDVVSTGMKLHELLKIERYLNSIDKIADEDRGNVFTQESAEKYLGVPTPKFEEFKQVFENEADGGLHLLKGRIHQKIFEQKVRIAAGVISIIAISILLGLAFSPTPVAYPMLRMGKTTAKTFAGIEGARIFQDPRAARNKLTPNKATSIANV